MSVPRSHPLRRVVDVRQGEVGALLLAFAYFFCLLCGYSLLRPLRDAWGIEGGTDKLPWLFTGTFLTMLAVYPLYGAVVARAPRRRIVPIAYRFFALNLLAFWVLLEKDVSRQSVGYVFFVWLSVFNVFVVAIFWSFMADLFSSEQGRRLFGFIAVGGTLGALAGPLLTRLLVERAGTGALLLIAAALLEACTQCVGALLRHTDARQVAGARAAAVAAGQVPAGAGGTPPEVRVGGSILGGMRLVLSDRYMLGVAAQILCLTTTATLLYKLQADIVHASASGTEQRTATFANIELVVTSLEIVLQFFVTAPLLRWAGLGVALRLLPVLTALGCVLLAAWPTVLVITLFQGVRRAVQYAIYRPSRELLLTVVDRERKYATKGFIDTVVYRGGDWASIQAFAGLEFLGLKMAGLALTGLPVAAGWFALSGFLARRQQALAAGLAAAPARVRAPADTRPSAARLRRGRPVPARHFHRHPAPSDERSRHMHALAPGLLSLLLLSLSVSAQGAAVQAAPAARATPNDAMPEPQRILILGGTGFLGPEIVDAATARGHHITLFNRGKTRPDLFKDRPEIEILHGDRDEKKEPGLTALREEIAKGVRWDAVVDTSGYVPRIVKDSATLLAPAVDQYVFISSISVFAEDVAPNSAEDGKLATMEDETNEEVMAHYGALKALCEQAAEAALPGRATNIRPGLIVGPGDPTDRFTYWPVTIARGGDVLCPGDGADPVQVIDVRDLADFTVRAIEQRNFGVYNAVGPERVLTMKELVDACVAGAAAQARDTASATNPVPVAPTLTWVPTAFLQEQQVAPWSDMPVWVPRGPDNGFSSINCGKAIAAGLAFRPAVDTVRDTLAWWETLPEARRAKLKAGLSPEREAEVLAAWKAQQAGG